MNSSVRKHQDILKLISLYKENPCLWDPSETGASAHDRRIVYDEIAAELGCSSEDVKNKLRNLRCQFRREVARQKRLNTRRPKWTYYNALSFLIPSIQYAAEIYESRHSRSKIQANESNVELEWESQLSPIDEETVMTNFNENSPSNSYEDRQHIRNETNSEEKVTSAISSTAKRKSSENRVVVISQQRSDERDEFTIFGEHVANELRLLEKHKDLQKFLKCTILQSILDVNRVVDANATEEVYTDETYLEEYATRA